MKSYRVTLIQMKVINHEQYNFSVVQFFNFIKQWL